MPGSITAALSRPPGKLALAGFSVGKPHLMRRGRIVSACWVFGKPHSATKYAISQRRRNMKCYVHPEAEAVATCTGCGKAVCQTCAIDVGGKIFCQQCLASGVPTQRAAIERTPTNPLAIISLALGILGLIGCCCGGSIGGLIFGLPAAITGWVARRQILEGSQPGRPDSPRSR